MACARPLLGPEGHEGSDGGSSSSEGPLGESTDDGEPSTTDAPEPTCHASYEPCLPIVDDLDCSEVRDLGLAPVVVIGDDAYGLDADGDGIGCE